MDPKIINCPNCDAELPNDAQFCGMCGSPISQTEEESSTPSEDSLPQPAQIAEGRKCPRCQHPAEPSDEHCQACGFPLDAGSIEEVQSPIVEDTSDGEPPSEPVPVAESEKVPAPEKVKTKAPKEAAPRKPVNIKNIIIIAVVIGISIGGYFAWQWWQNRAPDSTIYSELEPCKPEEPGENFTLSNKIDLNGDINKDLYFASGEEYLIAENSSLVVPEGFTLLIEPGARVKFGEGSKLVVNGTLLACGKTNRRILFTANTSSGYPGFWYGIEFVNSEEESVLGHVTIEYAGKDQHSPIWLENIDLHLEDVELNTNDWYSISFNLDSFPQIRLPLVVENGLQGWEVRSGQMNEDRVWRTNQTLIVNGSIEVAEGASLTISPGTVLKYLPGSRLRIIGELRAQGTQEEPIMMSSVNDTEEEGTLSPSPGDWGGLQFIGKDSTVQLDYLEIHYAGNPNIQPACIYIENSDPVLNHITISECQTYAISTDIMAEPSIDDLNLPGIEVIDGWELRSSTLEINQERTLSNLPLADGETELPAIVTGWVRVLAQAELSIDPGTILLFKNGKNSGILSEGGLIISGTEEEAVVLTSWGNRDFGGTQGAEPGDWGGLVLNNNKVDSIQISNLHISFGGSENTNCLVFSNSYPQIDHLEIENCLGAPINSDAASIPELSNLRIADNVDSNIYQIRESSLEDRREYTWAPINTVDGEEVIRRVTGRIDIKPDASLRLAPGLVMQFSENGSLHVQGSFHANGTAENSILLTSQFDPEGGGQRGGSQPGDWAGITLEGNQNPHILENIIINYAGSANGRSACLRLVESAAVIKNVRISNCDNYPISSDIVSTPEVENLSLVDNYPSDEWAIRPSELPAGFEITWAPISADSSQDQIIRVLTGWISVSQDAKLNIQPGVVLKFQQDIGLYSEGTLSLAGTAENKIVLTSWRDPDYSSETGVQAGDWVGLVLNQSKRDSVLEHVEINYSGGQNNPRGSLSLIDSSPTINDLSIKNGDWYPISIDMNSDPVMDTISFSQNQPGNGVEIRSSHLTVPGEKVFDYWSDSLGQQVIRVATGELIVDENASLVVNPDVILKFTEGGKLVSFGGLTLRDAVLTSVFDDAYFSADEFLTGERVWHGVEINGKQFTQLDNTIIRFANIGLRLIDAAPQLSDVRISHSWVAAIESDLISDLTQFSNLLLEQNAVNGVLIRESEMPEGESIWAQINFEGEQVVRVFDRNLVVGANANLLIEPGVVIKFLPEAGLIVDGILSTDPLAGLPVVFTSFADDEIGGDTDNLNEIPRRGSWVGLDVNPNDSGAEVYLYHSSIKYANVGLRLTNLENWEFSDLLIENSQGLGLSCDESILFNPAGLLISLVDNGIPTEFCPTPDR